VIPLGLALSVLVGFALGLLGGGGSILTVPVLVGILGIEPSRAITMSLVVVGATSAIGAAAAWWRNQLAMRVALAFGAGSVPGALGGAQLTSLVSEANLARLFGGLMLIVAASMLRRPPTAPSRAGEGSVLPVAAAGMAVGILTGFLGVGGGFVILPALLWVGRLSMRPAIATSLAVISLSSAAGFIGHLRHTDLDWALTAAVAGLAVAGRLAGQALAHRVATAQLRGVFAALVTAVGLIFLVQHWRP
jgi:uncharacterized membrane protein YfcA